MKHKLEFSALTPVNMVNFFIDALILYEELHIIAEVWCRNTGEAVDLKTFPLGLGTHGTPR